MSGDERAMTIRLAAEDDRKLTLVARVLGQSKAEVIRVAIRDYINGNLTDPAFHEKRAEAVERLVEDARELQSWEPDLHG